MKGDERRWYYRLGPSCPSVLSVSPPVRPRPSRAHPHRVVQEFGGEVGGEVYLSGRAIAGPEPGDETLHSVTPGARFDSTAR